MKYNKGFTLIEMLIVVAIIAILSGVVLAGVSNFQSRARDTRRIGDMKNIQNYLELYFNKCSRYPGDATCAANNPASWNDLTTAMASVMGTSKFPQPQVTANPYCYGVSADGLTYAVGTVLENDNSILKESADPTKLNISAGNTGDCTGKTYVYWVSS